MYDSLDGLDFAPGECQKIVHDILDTPGKIETLIIKKRSDLEIGDVTVHSCSSYLVLDVDEHPRDKTRRDNTFFVIPKKEIEKRRLKNL